MPKSGPDFWPRLVRWIIGIFIANRAPGHEVTTMADDPKKRGPQDRANVSSQPHELAYLRQKVREEYPRIHQTTINDAVTKAKREVGPSESRAKIMSAVRKNLDSR